MASTSSIIKAMNNISLEDEEGGLILDIGVEGENKDVVNNIDVKLCLAVHFLVEGEINFVAIKHTLAV